MDIARRTLLISVFAALACATAHAEPHVKVRLVSDQAAIVRGESFRVGVHFAIPDRAHIYWSNPGDSGLPTEIEWALPDGFQVGRLQWPNPRAFPDDVLNETTFGYSDEVVLFSIVRAPYGIHPGDTIPIRAHVSWLVCTEDGTCTPEHAELGVDIAVKDAAVISRDSELIDRFATRAPTGVSDAAVPVNVVVEGKPSPEVRIELEPPWHVEPRSSTFFPDHGGAWRTEAAAANNSVRFTPLGPVDASARGAVTLAVVNADTRERRKVYVRFGPPPGD